MAITDDHLDQGTPATARRLGNSLPTPPLTTADTVTPGTSPPSLEDDPLSRLESRVAAGGTRSSRGKPRIGGKRGFRFTEGPDKVKTLSQVVSAERTGHPRNQQERSAAESRAFFDEARQRRAAMQPAAPLLCMRNPAGDSPPDRLV